MPDHVYASGQVTDDGGFFAPAVAVRPVLPQGEGAPASVAGGPRPGLADVPPTVVAAASFVVVAAVAALWLGVTGLLGVQAAHASVGGGAPADSFVTKCAVLLVNGVADLVLVHQLLRGGELGRVVVSGVCGGWVLYWLYETSKASHLVGQVAAGPLGDSGFGEVATMLSLGTLLLAGWALLTAALLWTPAATRHFVRR